jgi:beta-aspartyl-dipeptidase (metallo-type)
VLELVLNACVYAPEFLGRRHLLVASGRVLWLGAVAPALPADWAVRVTDLGGRRVVPGLIDAHVHVTGGGGESGFASRVPPQPLTVFTLGGVTTVVGLLGTDDLVRTPESLLAAVRGLREEGLSAWCYTGGYHVPPPTITGSVRGDLVHIGPMIGVGELAISDHRSSQPTYEELIRIGSEAHVAGLMTGKAGVVHLHLGDGPRGLEMIRRAVAETELPARVWYPTHVNRKKALFEEALELAGRGVPIDVTAFPVAEGEDAWAAAAAVERYWQTGLPAERITVSSDAGGCLPVFDADGRVAAMDVGRPRALGQTIRQLLAAGHPLEQVLPPFTSNVARVLRLPGKGRITVGGAADLVALGDDDSISDVMARGVWHVRQGRAVVHGTFEAAEAASARQEEPRA